MQAVGRLGSFITRGVCTVSGPFLPYGGAVDIVVVQQKDGSFKSSPWFVRFGKLHRVLKANEKVVNISVNGVEPDFQMYMNHQGEAFFLREVKSEELEDGDCVLYESSSSSSSSSDDAEDDISLDNKRNFKSKSCKFGPDRSSSGDLVDLNNENNTLNRTSSRRSRILGLVLGQRSFKREVEDGIELIERAEVAANLYELMWSTNLTVDQLPSRDRKKTRGDTMENDLQPPRIKMEAVCDTTRSDLKAASVDCESCVEKKLNGEEVSGVSEDDKGDMDNNNSEKNISADGVQSPDYRAHAKVLQERTVLISEVAETVKVTTNNDLGIPAMDVSDLLSQQRDYQDAGVGNLPKFQKSHTINVFQRRRPVNKVRANTPTSEQLASLKLKEGRNMVTFSFSTAMLGTQQVEARIYLWKWDTRIVISDVDGTITRSDVLGQFMPMVGIDWSQSGVAHLFSAIQDNGYQLLFLSARAISQACNTRRFLCNLKQDGKVLPDGPVVISPDGLFPALYREVIRRAPHEFKIACLEGIKALFPPDCNPFYAGFGNRDTDEISYLKVGIPRGKIFIINPKGEVAVNRCLDTKSYTSMHAVVNGMFPPTDSSEQSSCCLEGKCTFDKARNFFEEDFNSWNYWKMPSVL